MSSHVEDEEPSEGDTFHVTEEKGETKSLEDAVEDALQPDKKQEE
mgnify:CR=1 FL=1